MLHETHETRISLDASSWDEICVNCGYTDTVLGWGKLAEPCQNKHLKGTKLGKWNIESIKNESYA